MAMFTFVRPSAIKGGSSCNRSLHSCPPRRPRPTLPITVQRMRSSKIAPSSCQKSTEDETQELFLNTSVAEKLFSSYQHPTPRGTARIAQERGIPLRDISEAYGHILAVTVLDDIPRSLDHDVFVNTMRDSLQVDNNSSDTVNITRLSTLVSRATDPTQTMTSEDVHALSQLYGGMLAESVRLSGLEFDATALTNGTRARLADVSTPFPMTREAYDDGFENLQHCAATVQGSAAVDAADSFFKSLAADTHVEDLQDDGYVLAVHNPSPSPGPMVSHNNTVSLAARARLLDGRYILSAIPTRNTPPNFDNALKVSLTNLPHAFSAALMGLSIGDSRTVFYHPYAAHEVLPLFLSPDQTPPQAGLVIDLCLLHIH